MNRDLEELFIILYITLIFMAKQLKLGWKLTLRIFVVLAGVTEGKVMQEGCLAVAPGRRPPPMGGAGPGVVRRETGGGWPR